MGELGVQGTREVNTVLGQKRYGLLVPDAYPKRVSRDRFLGGKPV